MAVESITSVAPTSGPTGGGTLVRLTGVGSPALLEVLFGGIPAEVGGVHGEDGAVIIDVRSPGGTEGTVDIIVLCLDLPGSELTLPGAFTYHRPALVPESDLTRLVRTLLRELKRQLLDNVSLTVSIDYDDTTVDGQNVVAIATLPSLVLSGPRIEPNRFYSTNEALEVPVGAAEIHRYRPPLTVDLAFTLTGASDRTTELMNLMAAVATFLNRNRWVTLPRYPDSPDAELVRWEMDPDGEFRTRLDGTGDVRAFTCGFVVRGFDLDDGWALDVTRIVDDAELSTNLIPFGGAP